MKKLVLGSVALLSLSTLIFQGCQKENPTYSTPDRFEESKMSKPNPEIHDKSDGSSSCVISCFWGSCSVTCRGGRHGSAGVANCICIGLGPAGMLGSTASCTCGHLAVNVRAFHVGPEIIFDETNIENFVFLNGLTEGIDNAKMNRLKGSLNALIHAAENPNGHIRAEKFYRFVDDLADIEIDDANYLRSHLLNRAAICVRDL